MGLGDRVEICAARYGWVPINDDVNIFRFPRKNRSSGELVLQESNDERGRETCDVQTPTVRGSDRDLIDVLFVGDDS
jgi:hypothetical protein